MEKKNENMERKSDKKRQVDVKRIESLVWRLFRKVEDYDVDLIKCYFASFGFVANYDSQEKMFHYRHSKSINLHLKILRFPDSIKINVHIDAENHDGYFYDQNTDDIMLKLLEFLRAQDMPIYRKTLIYVKKQYSNGHFAPDEVIRNRAFMQNETRVRPYKKKLNIVPEKINSHQVIQRETSLVGTDITPDSKRESQIVSERGEKSSFTDRNSNLKKIVKEEVIKFIEKIKSLHNSEWRCYPLVKSVWNEIKICVNVKYKEMIKQFVDSLSNEEFRALLARFNAFLERKYRAFEGLVVLERHRVQQNELIGAIKVYAKTEINRLMEELQITIKKSKFTELNSLSYEHFLQDTFLKLETQKKKTVDVIKSLRSPGDIDKEKKKFFAFVQQELGEIKRELKMLPDRVVFVNYQATVTEEIKIRTNQSIREFKEFVNTCFNTEEKKAIRNVCRNFSRKIRKKQNESFKALQLENDFSGVDKEKESFLTWITDRVNKQKEQVKDLVPVAYKGVLLGSLAIVNLLISVKNKLCDKNAFLKEITSYYHKKEKKIQFSNEATIKELLFKCVKIARRRFQFVDFCLLVGIFATWSASFKSNFQKERMFVNMILGKGAGQSFPVRGSQELLTHLIEFNDLSNMDPLTPEHVLKIALNDFQGKKLAEDEFEKVLKVIEKIIKKRKKTVLNKSDLK